MGEASPLIVVLILFTLAVSASFFVLWLRARRLRDALKGQDGYKLMRILSNLFLVTGIFLLLTSLRQVLYISSPDDTELFRYAMAFVGALMLLGAFAWALFSIRAIINEGRREDDSL